MTYASVDEDSEQTPRGEMSDLMVDMFSEEPQFYPDGSRRIGMLPSKPSFPHIQTSQCDTPNCQICLDTPRNTQRKVAEFRNEFDQQEWNGYIDNAEMAIDDAAEKFGW
ncbi:MAG: hypothetical protein JRN62_03615 [Nitrososphaerota archaeon]|nr:hypothetical protein [Nitrososphaerota archaeon]MDG6948689.1 hypothetical protein [Nitrososphaerota archaeon]